jgi:hypothetical protein
MEISNSRVSRSLVDKANLDGALAPDRCAVGLRRRRRVGVSRERATVNAMACQQQFCGRIMSTYGLPGFPLEELAVLVTVSPALKFLIETAKVALSI